MINDPGGTVKVTADVRTKCSGVQREALLFPCPLWHKSCNILMYLGRERCPNTAA